MFTVIVYRNSQSTIHREVGTYEKAISMRDIFREAYALKKDGALWEVEAYDPMGKLLP